MLYTLSHGLDSIAVLIAVFVGEQFVNMYASINVDYLSGSKCFSKSFMLSCLLV